MKEDFQQQQKQKLSTMRSIMDYTMGILFVLIGVYFLLYRLLGMKHILNSQPSMLDYLLGVLFAGYGSWRIYRGYKKNYHQ